MRDKAIEPQKPQTMQFCEKIPRALRVITGVFSGVRPICR